MSIIKPSKTSAPVFFPKGNYEIVKYLDLTKFLSLLQRNALFFCRLDKLEDKFEGTTSQTNFELRVQYWKELRNSGFFKVPISDEKILENVNKQYETEKNLKSEFCVNCWNKFETESAALWKIYSDFSKGIMIKSSISNLVKSFEIENREIQLSEIHYLDYDRDTMIDGNIFFPVIHKQKAYSFEDEVRLIFKTEESYWEKDWTKEEVEEGLYLKVDIKELIEQIIISPYSPNWFYKLVENISEKYKLNKPIIKSALSLSNR